MPIVLQRTQIAFATLEIQSSGCGGDCSIVAAGSCIIGTSGAHAVSGGGGACTEIAPAVSGGAGVTGDWTCMDGAGATGGAATGATGGAANTHGEEGTHCEEDSDCGGQGGHSPQCPGIDEAAVTGSIVQGQDESEGEQ